jgi:transcriptional regulator with XRE-family HTH domain
MELKPMIRDRRMEEHMKQCEFADKLGISQTQLSRYERGAAYPSLEILYQMEQLLDCSLKDLYSSD